MNNNYNNYNQNNNNSNYNNNSFNQNNNYNNNQNLNPNYNNYSNYNQNNMNNSYQYQGNNQNYQQNGNLYQGYSNMNNQMNNTDNNDNYYNQTDDNNNEIENELYDNNNNPKKGKGKIIGIIVGVILIVVLFYIVKIVLSAMGVMNVLDKTRASAFKSDATNFVQMTNNLIMEEKANYIANKSTKYYKSCENGAYTLQMSLNEIMNYSGSDTPKSPFGDYYDCFTSYIKVDATPSNEGCDFNYSIFLTDGTYSLGKLTKPVEVNEIGNTNVLK